jgi:broad specificity phosphatase PhoE
MTTTILDLIRHGEPEGGRRIRGNGCDDPLSERGWQQMWRAVAQAPGWDAIVSSPMQRCAAFAQALGERRALGVTIDPRLREVGFGAWEGRTPADIQAADPDLYAAFYRDPVNARPAGAEPLQQFSQRVIEAMERLLSTHAGGHILCVAHAGVVRAALGHTLAAPAQRWYRIRIDNAGLSRIRVDDSGLSLDFHNRTTVV